MSERAHSLERAQRETYLLVKVLECLGALFLDREALLARLRAIVVLTRMNGTRSRERRAEQAWYHRVYRAAAGGGVQRGENNNNNKRSVSV